MKRWLSKHWRALSWKSCAPVELDGITVTPMHAVACQYSVMVKVGDDYQAQAPVSQDIHLGFSFKLVGLPPGTHPQGVEIIKFDPRAEEDHLLKLMLFLAAP